MILKNKSKLKMVNFVIKILRIRNNYQAHKMVILNKDNINKEEITKKEIIFQIFQFYKNRVKINKLKIWISLKDLFMVNKNQTKQGLIKILISFYKKTKRKFLVLI